MTYIEYINLVRDKIGNTLNAFLAAKGLKPVRRFVTNGFDVSLSDYTVAVYSDTPQGSALAQEENAIVGKVTLEFYLNATANAKSVELCEEYYSAIFEYLLKTDFVERDTVTDTQICRTDNGWDYNGCLFLISSIIQSVTDWDF